MQSCRPCGERFSIASTYLVRRAAFLLIVVAVQFSGVTPDPECIAAHPNIVFILADDLGWRDLSCYQSDFYETPNIDRLAKEGMRFTAAYSACPVCSPTRASLMTGKYPTRTGVTDYLSDTPYQPVGRKLVTPPNGTHLASEEVTLGEILKAGGYRTFYAGKWHLGTGQFDAGSQGFDQYVGNDVLGKFATDWQVGERLTDAAVQYLEKRDRSAPFFMFLSYHEPHRPVLEYPRHIEHFRAKSKLAKKADVFGKEHDGQYRQVQDDPAYGSEIAGLDENVGRVLNKLDSEKLSADTIVIFFSDNGGLAVLNTPPPTSNAPLRAGKGWLYEGGIRVPLIVRAPGLTKNGTTCDVPVASFDLAPTVVELAGLAAQPAQHLDSRSIVELLRGGVSSQARSLFWHYPHYHNSTTWKTGGAIRDGDWKLIEFFEQDSIELYDLRNDIGERNNIASQHAAKVNELRGKLAEWRKATGAIMPTKNPDPKPN